MRPAWLPARTEGALKNVTTAYAYKPVEEEGTVVIEPTEALAATRRASPASARTVKWKCST